MKRVLSRPTVSNSRCILMEVFSLVGGSWEKRENHRSDGKPVPPCWVSDRCNSYYFWPEIDPWVIMDTDCISIASYSFDGRGNLIPIHNDRIIIEYNQNDLEFLENVCNLNHAIAYSFRDYFTSIECVRNYDENTIKYITVPYIHHEFEQIADDPS